MIVYSIIQNNNIMAFTIPFSPIIVPTKPNVGNPEILVSKTADEFRELYVESVQMFGYYPDMKCHTETEKSAIHIDYLLHMNDIKKVYSFCNEFGADELKHILNENPECMYYGNVLHTVLYLYSGDIALELYKFFRNAGAVPFRNYYYELPWEIGACYWTSIPKMVFERNYLEFSDTYEKVMKYEETTFRELYFKLINTSKVPIPCYCGFQHNKDEESIFDFELDDY